MFSEKYLESLLQVAADYDGISTELFDAAQKLRDFPEYDPQFKLYSLVRCAESNTVQLRNLTARTMWQNAEAMYETLASDLGIKVTEEFHWIKITVPAILPSRNRRDNTLFITRPLRASLVQFQRLNPMERFRDCGICIVHKYDAALGLRRVRDYDNIETKRYLDVIEAVLLTNDSGLLCSVLQTTEIGDKDCTEFYLMRPECLSIWAKEHVKSHT